MKTLLCGIAAALFSLANLEATTIQLTGTANWKFTDPDCTFTLDGSLSNPTSTLSGTIKLVLWMSVTPFPAAGSSVSELTLGQISAGGQIGAFSNPAPLALPKVTGDYEFTILVMEYTTLGWQTRTYVATGKKHVENGQFLSDSIWTIPGDPIVAPPGRIVIGGSIVLNLRAAGGLSVIPAIYQAKTTIAALAGGKATMTISGLARQAVRTYSVGTDTLNGTSVPVGKLYLDFAKATGATVPSNSTITLYFKNSNSGVYRHESVNPVQGGTTWGLFSYRRVP